MALINHQQPIFGEVIDQTFGRCARLTPSQMARIVLDAIAVAHLFQHLQVVGGALLQALGFQQPALEIEHVESLPQLCTDLLDRTLQAFLGGYEVLGWINVDRIEALQNLARCGIDVANCLYLVAEQFNAHQPIFVGRPDLEYIAPHPETTAGDLHVVARVLVVDQIPQ